MYLQNKMFYSLVMLSQVENNRTTSKANTKTNKQNKPYMN